MARQEDVCWRCGARWASEAVPPTTLRALAGGRPVPPVDEFARAEARRDDDRWTNEGGSAAAEIETAPVRAVAAGR
jgi:hypothetical protein